MRNSKIPHGFNKQKTKTGMNRLKTAIIWSVTIFFVFGFTINNRLDALIKKEIKSVFEIDSYQKKVVLIPDKINADLNKKLTQDNFFSIHSDEELLGYYYVAQAYGKAAYFDFIIIVDPDLIISKIKILIYREDHGGEIGSKRWLKQFIGISPNRSLSLHDDIVSISGATISAHALTKEVNHFLLAMREFNKIKNNYEN
jgi:hypothetical protein